MTRGDVLLDTHTLLWLLTDRKKVSNRAESLAQHAAQLWVSVVSLWEATLLVSLKRIRLSGSIEDLVAKIEGEFGGQMLGIESSHLDQVLSLSFHHKDPFDRLLAAQALVLKVPILSKDAIFERYGVLRVW